MTTPTQIEHKINDVRRKREQVNKEIAEAEHLKQRHESDAVKQQEAAAAAELEEDALKHRHLAATALQAAQAEDKKIRTLTHKYAELDRDMTRLERELKASQKRGPGQVNHSHSR